MQYSGYKVNIILLKEITEHHVAVETLIPFFPLNIKIHILRKYTHVYT